MKNIKEKVLLLSPNGDRLTESIFFMEGAASIPEMM